MLCLALATLATTGIPHTLGQHLVGAPDELFAWATRFAGDVDGDGYGDVITYALGSSSGRARVQSGSTGLTLFTITGLSNPIAGIPIDGAGDVNGDGHDDFLVGNGALNYARLYSGLDGSILFEFSGLAPGDSFGGAVRGVGDIDGDGRPDVMVGSTNAQPGYVRVYSGANGSILHTFVGGYLSLLFGAALANVGDVNGDGHPDLAVGAFGDGHRFMNPGFPPFVPPFIDTDRAGTVIVYSGLDGQKLYTVFGLDAYEGFGYSVDGTGDIDGDGRGDFVVGSNPVDGTQGSAYARIVSGRDGSTIRTFLYHSPIRYRMASVSGAGDVNHDGVPDIIVGAAGGFPAPNAWVFSGLTGQTLFRTTVTVPQYAARVTVDGGHDVDQGGTDDFLIGALQSTLGLGFVDLYVAP